MKQSAGTLLYKSGQGKLEVMLVHPAGNYSRNAPWSVPKGEPHDGETLECAARRETLEETGVVAGDLTEIGSIDYAKSRKRVCCFAGPLPVDAVPACGSWEVDRVEMLNLTDARRLIHPEQVVFLDRLEEMLTHGCDRCHGACSTDGG